MDFRWNDWNLEHATRNGVTPDESEEIVLAARPPFPEYRGDGKWAVWGKTLAGRLLQVIYVEDDDDTDTAYVIHARPLTDKEKRRLRRRHR
jgi:hypothetical protein